jgi:hypothetical protein
MTQTERIIIILKDYVKWYNHTVKEFGFIPGPSEELTYKMWLEYNYKEDLDNMGFDLLFGYYNRMVTSQGVPDEATYSAYAD